MKISPETVGKVADLARLSLQQEEKENLASEMDLILAYVDKLNELKTDDITPTAHAVPLENAFRQDCVKPSLGSEKALSNAPDSIGGYFRVPKVIE